MGGVKLGIAISRRSHAILRKMVYKIFPMVLVAMVI